MLRNLSCIVLGCALVALSGACTPKNSAIDDGTAVSSDDGRREGLAGFGENTAALCSDGISNDGDPYVDCADFECCGLAACGCTGTCAGRGACRVSENTSALCSDGISNDGDAYVDCSDYDCCGTSVCGCGGTCAGHGTCPVVPENTDAMCSDGISNDGDAYVDCGDYDCCGTAVCGCAGTCTGRGRCETLRSVTVLYTSDEHGYIVPDHNPGPAALLQKWRDVEGYTEDGPFLVMSGGDLWSGGVYSNWVDGESTIEVLNAMGYDASAVGNHELDFGQGTLTTRAAQARFPLLAANLRTSTGEVPEKLGVRPYVIATVNDLRIGIIGLSSLSTPTTTMPQNVADLVFVDYEKALREWVPVVEAQGVDLIFVPSHLCDGELDDLAAAVADLGIDLFGGGHCHGLYSTSYSGVPTLGGGNGFWGYGYANFLVDPTANQVVSVSFGTRENDSATVDPALAAIIAGWQTLVDADVATVIGYTQDAISGPLMRELAVEPALVSFPAADLAFGNAGAIRSGIDAGTITYADILTAFPFRDPYIDIELTGADINAFALASVGKGLLIGGGTLQGSGVVLDVTGAPLVDSQVYHVVVNQFVYQGGDHMTGLMALDPDGIDTGVLPSDTIADWVKAQSSSDAQPLVVSF